MLMYYCQTNYGPNYILWYGIAAYHMGINGSLLALVSLVIMSATFQAVSAIEDVLELLFIL